MIIFEGADGVGKSLRAMAVVQRWARRGLLRRFEHYGVLPPTWDYRSGYLRSVQPFAVLDRFILSEEVYGALLRGGPHPLFKRGGLSHAVVSRELQRCGAVTCLVRTSPRVVMDTVKRRGDKLVRPDAAANAVLRFDAAVGANVEVLHRTESQREGAFPERSAYDNTRLCVIDSGEQDGDHEDWQLEVAATMAEEAETATHWYRELCTDGHGPLDATCQAVVVGEQLGGGGWEAALIPRAFAGGKTSEYLHELLVLAGLDPCRVHMVNAFVRGTRIPPEALRWAEQLRLPFVALGVTASRLLSDYGIEHIQADHPLYVRRFFYEAQAAVATWLREELAKHADKHRPKPQPAA